MTRFAVLSPAKAGRPRDPQLEERVFRAALDLYGEAGWAGFNLTKIAAEAGVGKWVDAVAGRLLIGVLGIVLAE